MLPLYQQQPKEVSYHRLAILKHHHHNNEYNVDNNYNNVNNTVSATRTQERSTSPHSSRNGIRYHQVFNTTKCGILHNHRITAFEKNLAFCHCFLTGGSPFIYLFIL